MSFKTAIEATQALLQAGDVEKARIVFDLARAVAASKAERILAHDMGNTIQRAIFEAYV